MQTKAVKWLHLALKDLDTIGGYLAKQDLQAAQNVAQHIWDAGQSLAIAPARGRAGCVAGTRELVLTAYPYALVYRIAKGQTQILRILHTSRQYPV